MGLRAAGLDAWPGRTQSRRDSSTVVKKLLVVIVLALSAFAVWRKVQADRAELDLWTAATTDDD
jgi:hypothetical protein